jgi:hypothetical protein
MCTYNGERFLRDQLDSIAAQTRLPDDFAAGAPFPVRAYVNPTNLGTPKNFERAIGLAPHEDNARTPLNGSPATTIARHWTPCSSAIAPICSARIRSASRLSMSTRSFG